MKKPKEIKAAYVDPSVPYCHPVTGEVQSGAAWLPMDLYPDDGTEVIARGYYSRKVRHEDPNFPYFSHFQPTHWKPDPDRVK